MPFPSDNNAAILPVILVQTNAQEQKMPLDRQLLTDAELWWQADFLPAPVVQHWYALLQPRLLCWYGEASYTYSKLTLPATPWPAWLLPLKQQVEQAVGASFNGVLLNYYRDGQDSMGWHSDDEPELGRDPLIASVSLGAARRFTLKHKQQPLKHELSLTAGSLLVMAGHMQHHWLHALPKMARVQDGRINLTFRQIISAT
jgi:alkylated DNA repair dioxygenase AlkB